MKTIDLKEWRHIPKKRKGGNGTKEWRYNTSDRKKIGTIIQNDTKSYFMVYKGHTYNFQVSI